MQADITHVASIDAGGFPLAGGIAYRLQAGLVLIRKGGRVDWELQTITCLDFSGTEKSLEIARDAVTASDRVLLVDDWSETGGAIASRHHAARRIGGEGNRCRLLAHCTKRPPRSPARGISLALRDRLLSSVIHS